ncbi:DNA polymerase IV [Plantibacter sp. YIM 135249]|jgi:DNA polymerase-4|uniref:DNA polymerase IV n=1 Tax=Plantibacter sp. YIM 135249 TaxID=3423918 RepID=UPI003D355221
MSRQDGASRRVSDTSADDSATHIMHVDMDAFFVSVELLQRPDLRGQPIIVGHREGRSVVTSASYEARRYGVRAAMPVSQALRLCPGAYVLEPHHGQYRKYSDLVMQVFESVTPLVEPLSIDEAFLDISGAIKLMGRPMEIARIVKERVFQATGLPCSVGIAATKYVAKLASGLSKPDGLLVVPAADTVSFLQPLPVGALWGVGGKTEEALVGRGIRTVGDVSTTPLSVLQRAVGEATGRKLLELASGLDPREVTTVRREKSVSHEVTFDTDIADPALVRREILNLSHLVAVRLRRGGFAGRTVGIRVRYEDFSVVSRSRTLGEPTNVGRRLYEEAVSLFDALDRKGQLVRLVGVKVEQLIDDADAVSALWDPDEEWRDAEATIDRVSNRFGDHAIAPASLLGKPRRRGLGRPGDSVGRAEDGSQER